MAKGITIPIASDTREFSQGVHDGVITPLEGAADALNAVGTGGQEAGDKLTAGFEKAQGATSEFEKAQVAAGQQFRRQQEANTEAVGVSVREQNRIQKEGVKAGASSAAQLVAGSASALQDIGTDAAGTISNVLATIAAVAGPAVAVAAGVGAAVFGLISGAITRADTSSKAFKADVQSLTDDMVETGKVGKASIGYIVDELKKLEDGTSSTGLNLDAIQKKATALGVPFRDLAESYAGSDSHLQSQIKHTQELLAAEQAYIDSINGATSASVSGLAITHDARTDALNQQLADLETLKSKLKSAATEQKLAAEAGLPGYERKLNLLKQLDGAYSDTSDATKKYLDVESGLFDVKDYIKAMDARAKALDDYRDNLNSSGLSGPAKDFLQTQGEDTAALMLAGYKKASAKQKAELDAIWSTQGQSAAGSYTGSFEAGVTAKTIKGPKVVIDPPDTDALVAHAQELLNRKKLYMQVVAKNGRRLL